MNLPWLSISNTLWTLLSSEKQFSYWSWNTGQSNELNQRKAHSNNASPGRPLSLYLFHGLPPGPLPSVDVSPQENEWTVFLFFDFDPMFLKGVLFHTTKPSKNLLSWVFLCQHMLMYTRRALLSLLGGMDWEKKEARHSQINYFCRYHPMNWFDGAEWFFRER